MSATSSYKNKWSVLSGSYTSMPYPLTDHSAKFTAWQGNTRWNSPSPKRHCPCTHNWSTPSIAS